MRNNIERAVEIYSEKGIKKLVYSIYTFIQYRAKSVWGRFVRLVISERFTKENNIHLNDVIVPVRESRIVPYIPYYDEPYPTSNDPYYEHIEVDAIRKYSDDCNSAVIIGGGLGVTAVVAAKETEGPVTVFEQSKNTFKILKKTVNKNGYGDQIKLICGVVGKISGSNFDHYRPPTEQMISPEDLPDADLYEMDCEGAEVEILTHMNSRPDILLVETHNNHDEVESVIASMGYEIIDVVRDGKNQHIDCTHIRARLSSENR